MQCRERGYAVVREWVISKSVLSKVQNDFTGRQNVESRGTLCQVCGGCGVDDVGIRWSWEVDVAVRVYTGWVVVRATRLYV